MDHGLFAELKRRNVFKAGVAYLALGWIVTQVSSTVAPLLHLPDWIGAVVLWIGVLAFPFVIMFSWIYEITPEGLKRESEVDRSASIAANFRRTLNAGPAVTRDPCPCDAQAGSAREARARAVP